MNKNVLGITAGLLAVMGFIGWSVYAGRSQPEAWAGSGNQQLAASLPLLQGPGNGSAESTPVGGVSSEQTMHSSSLTAEERNRLTAQVRTKLADIQANGTNATPQDTLSLIDDVEKLGGERFNQRYFQIVRGILEKSAKVQELNRELTGLASSKSASDIARAHEITSELRLLSENLATEAALLQKTPSRLPGSGTP